MRIALATAPAPDATPAEIAAFTKEAFNHDEFEVSLERIMGVEHVRLAPFYEALNVNLRHGYAALHSKDAAYYAGMFAEEFEDLQEGLTRMQAFQEAVCCALWRATLKEWTPEYHLTGDTQVVWRRR